MISIRRHVIIMNIFYCFGYTNCGDMMGNIKCDVYDCTYCMVALDLCSLDSIQVSKNKSTNDLEATKCASYESIKF